MITHESFTKESKQALAGVLRPDLHRLIESSLITMDEETGNCWYIYFDDDSEYCMTLSVFWIAAEDVLMRACRIYAVSKADSPTVALDISTTLTDDCESKDILSAGAFSDLMAAHFARLKKLAPLLLEKLSESGANVKPINKKETS